MARKVKYKKERSAVKGLSIASICLSALAILIGLIGIYYVSFAFGIVQIGDYATNIAQNTQLGFETKVENGNLIIGSSENNLVELFNIGLSLILGFTIFSFMTSCFSLAISIITLNTLSKKKFPTYTLPINIFNAIFSFVSCNFVRFIVIVVNCIFINKIKK